MESNHPLATPIQKRGGKSLRSFHRVAPKEPYQPVGVASFNLCVSTRVASRILGRNASIEDLIACTMLIMYGRRDSGNGPVGSGCRMRMKEAAWLFYKHVEARADGPLDSGFLDDLMLEARYYELKCAEANGRPIAKGWVPVGRDCGYGSNSICLSTESTNTIRSLMSFENLNEWKQDLPQYLHYSQQRAYAQLHRRTNVRRAWALLRRHAHAVDTAARVVFFWQEETQRKLCAPDGAGRAADRAAFEAEF